MGYIYAKNGATQQTVTTGYAPDGRITSAGFLHSGALKNFEYSYLPGSNLLEKLSLPNNMTLTQSYEAQRDLLTDMTYKRGDTLVTQRSYAYDALGRPLTRDTQYPGKGITHNDSFAHNSRSELVSAQVNDEVYTYSYDNIGNRESAQEAAEKVTQYEANRLNQYTSIVDGSGAFEPIFDLAGNQTLVKTSTGIWHVTYNAENRPISFTSEDGSTIVECAYDYMGRRSTKKVTSKGLVTHHLRYIYRGYLQIAAINLQSNAVLWLITWDPTQRVRTRPLAVHINESWYTYGWDITKSICELYSNSGETVVNYTYTPYGKVTTSGKLIQPIQWGGEVFDLELGSTYYNYRYYHWESGRWTQRDPEMEKKMLNLYNAYRNCPVSNIDFLGLDVWHCLEKNAVCKQGHSGYIIGNDKIGYFVFNYPPAHSNSIGSGFASSGSNSSNSSNTQSSSGSSNSGSSSGSSGGESQSGSSESVSGSNTFASGSNGGGKTLDEAKDSLKALGCNFDICQKWKLTQEEDLVAIQAASKYMGEGYKLLGHNCYQIILVIRDAVNKTREKDKMQADEGPRPRGGFYTNEENNYAERVN